MEDRLTELETKVAFQEDTLLKLRDAVAEQEQLLYRLSQELESIRKHLIEPGPSGAGPMDEKPPHY